MVRGQGSEVRGQTAAFAISRMAHRDGVLEQRILEVQSAPFLESTVFENTVQHGVSAASKIRVHDGVLEIQASEVTR
jgi:hypothetical protein